MGTLKRNRWQRVLADTPLPPGSNAREFAGKPSASASQFSEVKLKPQLQLARPNRGVGDLPEVWIVH